MACCIMNQLDYYLGATVPTALDKTRRRGLTRLPSLLIHGRPPGARLHPPSFAQFGANLSAC
jgi:hypothetical protein